jgi:hypothetical protein
MTIIKLFLTIATKSSCNDISKVFYTKTITSNEVAKQIRKVDKEHLEVLKAPEQKMLLDST